MTITYRIRSAIGISLQVIYFIITETVALAALELEHYIVVFASASFALFSFVNQKNWDKKHKLKYWSVCLLNFIIIFIVIFIQVGIEMKAT